VVAEAAVDMEAVVAVDMVAEVADMAAVVETSAAAGRGSHRDFAAPVPVVSARETAAEPGSRSRASGVWPAQ
jgi:hypothetical protein